MKIYFVNNVGTGFSGEIEVEDGTTIAQFFQSQMGDKHASDFAITVNKLETPPSRVLRDGDCVTIVPGKISGA